MANPRGKGLRNVSKLRRKLRRMPDAVEKHVKPAIEESAQVFQFAAGRRAAAHKRTGELQRALLDPKRIKMSRDGLSVRIGFHGKKAKRLFERMKLFWLEFGTQKQPATPVFGPAFDETRGENRRRIEKGVNDALKETARGG